LFMMFAFLVVAVVNTSPVFATTEDVYYDLFYEDISISFDVTITGDVASASFSSNFANVFEFLETYATVGGEFGNLIENIEITEFIEEVYLENLVLNGSDNYIFNFFNDATDQIQIEVKANEFHYLNEDSVSIENG